MATWIQGIQQYTPQAQPYQPDFNYMQQVTSAKQTKYDYAKRNLSNLYGSLLNSPLTREDNIQSRDKFFQEIDTDIKKMASLDLSKSSNVDAANEIFSQLLDDKAISHDLTWTKNFNDQVSRSELLKIDGKRDNGDMWWEGGERLLQYAREEYKNASPEDAMRIGNINYVPAKDIYSMAMKIAKDNDMEVSIEQSNGSYIIKQKNGNLAYNSFGQIFMGVLGSDAGLQQYYNAKAQLNMKDFAYANKDVYGSMAAAEQAYCDQIGEAIEKQYRDLINQSTSANNENKEKVKRAKEKVEQIEGTPQEKSDMMRLIADYENQGNMLDKTESYLRSSDGALIKRGKYSAGQIISMMSSVDFMSDLSNVTKAVADMNMSVEMEADPYGLEAVKFAHQLELENVKYQYEIQKENFKKGLGKSGSAEGNQQDVMFVDYDGALTNTEEGKLQFAAYDMRAKEEQKMLSDIVGYEKAYVGRYLDVLEQEINSGEKGTLAKDYYIGMVSAGMNSSGAGSFGQGQNNEYQDTREQFKKEMEEAGNDKEKKYEICRRYSTKMDNNAESWSIMSKYAVKNFNPSNIDNKLLTGDIFNSLWSADNMVNLRQNFQAQELALTQYRKALASSRQTIIDNIMASDKFGDERETANLADCIKSYFKEDGTFASLEEYTNSLLNSDFANRNEVSEEDVRDFARYSYSGYETDYKFPISSNKEKVLNRFIDDDAWEVNEGHFWDTDKLFGVQDAMKTVWGMYSNINGDLEGQGMGYHKGMAFNCSGNDKNGMDAYANDVQDMLLQAINNPALVSLYNGAITSSPDKDDLLSGNDSSGIMSRIIRDLRDKDTKDVFQIMYANVAQNNPDMCALEITMPSNYFTANDNKALENGNISNKITLYMDKSIYTGRFKEFGENNALDYVMKVKGSYDLESESSYLKNMAIKKSRNGVYYITGQFFDGEKYQLYDSSVKSSRTFTSPAAAYSFWQQLYPYLVSMCNSVSNN